MDTQMVLEAIRGMLASGTVTPEKQRQMASDLLPVSIEHRRMRVTLDELTHEAAEQQQIDDRRRAEEQLVAARRLGLRVLPAVHAENVVELRPAHPAMPPVVAVVEEVWR